MGPPNEPNLALRVSSPFTRLGVTRKANLSVVRAKVVLASRAMSAEASSPKGRTVGTSGNANVAGGLIRSSETAEGSLWGDVLFTKEAKAARATLTPATLDVPVTLTVATFPVSPNSTEVGL